mgnify:CR=1 FL=1|jgi:hypothetical protein
MNQQEKYIMHQRIKSLIFNPDLINISLDDSNLNKIFNQKLNKEVKKYLEEEKKLKNQHNNKESA